MKHYNKYYVYAHVDPVKGDVVYIGMGSGQRAWMMRTSTGAGPQYGHRSAEHFNWFQKLETMGYTLHDIVSILETNLTKEQARVTEKWYLNKVNDKVLFNRDGNKHFSLQRKNKVLRSFYISLREMGYSYSHIAYLCGAESQHSRENKKAMSVWRYING